MRRNKDAYMNYVCPNCFNTLNKCTCELFPPYNLIWVDRAIQEHIRILNNKGYKTMFSCEGHNGYIHIVFVNGYNIKELKLPDGYLYDDKKFELKFILNNNLSDEKQETQRVKALNDLLEWCNNLLPIK